MIFKFKPFLLTFRLLLTTFFLFFTPFGISLFIKENAPLGYYLIFIFLVWGAFSGIISLIADATYLRLNQLEKSINIKTRFNTKSHSITFDEIIGFTHSSVNSQKIGFWTAKSVVVFTETKSFEFISYSIFSFPKLSEYLLEMNFKYFEVEPFETTLLGNRKDKAKT